MGHQLKLICAPAGLDIWTSEWLDVGMPIPPLNPGEEAAPVQCKNKCHELHSVLPNATQDDCILYAASYEGLTKTYVNGKSLQQLLTDQGALCRKPALRVERTRSKFHHLLKELKGLFFEEIPTWSLNQHHVETEQVLQMSWPHQEHMTIPGS